MASILKGNSFQNKFLLQELNVRKLTTTTDKQKYGVQFRAEPDHKVLGGKLKSALKAVTEEIRKLSDEQLTTFLQTGQIDVGGYVLEAEDLRVMFTSSMGQGHGDTLQYEAHSDGQVSLQFEFLAEYYGQLKCNAMEA